MSADATSNPFEPWYESGGQGTGVGSTIEYTARYREFLQDFLRQHGIRSVVDFGCGDWKFSKLIDWSGVRYTGCEVVPLLVEYLHGVYARAGVRFILVDRFDPCIPMADLVIVKDVLQHLSNADALRVLHNLKRQGRVLLVNDTPREAADGGANADIETGGYRPLNFALQPFYLTGLEEVFDFNDPGYNKRVFLWRPIGAVQQD